MSVTNSHIEQKSKAQDWDLNQKRLFWMGHHVKAKAAAERRERRAQTVVMTAPVEKTSEGNCVIRHSLQLPRCPLVLTGHVDAHTGSHRRSCVANVRAFLVRPSRMFHVDKHQMKIADVVLGSDVLDQGV